MISGESAPADGSEQRARGSFLNAGRRGVPISAFAALSFTLLLIGLNALTFGLHRGAVFWGVNHPHAWGVLYSAVSLPLQLAAALLVATPNWVNLEGRRLPVFLGLIFALYLLTARLALETFLNSGDEYTFLFQSQTYLAGRLWNPAPPLGEALTTMYNIVANGKWVGQYPPGWPLIIAGATLLHLPYWAINSVLTTAVAALLFTLGRDQADSRTGALATLLFALAPFTVFTAASLHTHPFTALLVLAAVGCAERALTRRSIGFAFAVGALVGLLAITRYFTAAIVGVPIAICFLFSPARVRLSLAATLTGLPFLVGLGWFHWSITGDPLRPAYWLSGRTVDRLYFDLPSIVHGLWMTIEKLWEFTVWTGPATILLWAYLLAVKIRRGKIKVADLVFPFAIFALIFYPLDGGNRFGPRYYFEFWPVACYTISTGLPLVENVRLRSFLMSACLLSIVYGVMSLPFLAHDYRKIVETRRDLYDQVAEKGLAHAVVCFETGTGVMLPLSVVDLARNGISADGNVIYARCDLAPPSRLKQIFPDRPIWVYDREPTAERGSLTLALK